MRAVVGAVEDEGVVGDSQFVQELQQLADVHVVLDHAVGVLVLTGDPAELGLDVRAEVHAGSVPPAEERLAGLHLAPDEVDGRVGRVVVDRLHPLPGERAGVLDPLRAVGIGPRVDHTPRTEALAELGILRVVLVLRLLLGVEVVEVAEELVEAVHGRQVLVAVAEVVLPELPRGVPAILQKDGDGGILGLESEFGTWQTHLAEARAEHALAGDERGAAGGAALLAVVVGEDHAFLGDAVDVRRAIAHQPHRVGADVRLADVVAPDDQDVRLGAGTARLGVHGTAEQWNGADAGKEKGCNESHGTGLRS